MAQLVALMSGVVLGGVAEVVGSNLARGKIFTASIGSVDSLYPSVYICVCEIYMFTVLTHFVLCIKTVQRLQYCMILFHVSEVMLNSMHYFLK